MADKERKIKITGDAGGVKATIDDLKASTIKSFDAMQKEADKSTRSIDASFRKLGIRQEKNAKKNIEDSKKAFKIIKNDANSTTGDIKRAHNALTAQIKRNNTEIKQSQKSLNSVVDGFKTRLLGVGVALVGIGIGIKKAVDFVALGASIKVQENAFSNLAASYGADSDKIIRDLKEVSKGTVDTLQLINSANQALLLGIDPSKLTGLLNIARAASKATGESVSKQFADIVLGSARQSKLILDNLGILVSVKKANEEYAKSLMKTVSELTDAEKKTAFLNATVAAGEIILKNVGKEYTSSADILAQFKTQLVNVKNAAAKLFTAVFIKSVVRVQQLFLETARTVVFFGLQVGKVTDFLKITTVGAETMRLGIKDLERQISGLEHQLEDVSTEGERFAATAEKTRKNAIAEKAALADLNKVLAEKNRLAKIENDLIVKNTKDKKTFFDIFIEAGETQIEQLKKIDKLSSDAVKRQKELVKSLSVEVESAKTFLESVLQTQEDVARSKVVGQKQGTSKAKVELGFVAEDISAAESLIQSGDVERARNLLQASIATAAEISKSVDVTRSVRQEADRAISDIVRIGQGMVDVASQAEMAAAESLKVKEGIDASNMAALNLAREGLQFAIDKATELKNILKQDTVATHTQKIVNEGGNVPGFNKGGQIPGGFGGGDKIHLLGEPGEVMIRKEMVREMGLATALKINKHGLKAALKSLPKFKNGGEIKNTSGRSVSVNLNLGTGKFPMTAPESAATGLLDEVNKINIINGRRLKRY